jgi:tRNA pseudouridine55 synthase
MSGDPAGLLLIDKPEGPTSHDVVDSVRRAIGIRRVGHTGTLDPFASGLLLLCVGWATRLAEYLTVLPKVYRGVIRLGVRTDTDDRTGTVIETSDGWQRLDQARISLALEEQVGEVEQVPPAFSAKKVAGQRAYSVTRGGGTPALRPQRVTIRQLSLRDLSPPDLTVELECTSGTYVRAVARDVGSALGVGGHLESLRRLRVGAFSVERALRPDSDAKDFIQSLQPPETAVAHLHRADLDRDAAWACADGRPVAWEGEYAPGPVAAHLDGKLVAICETRDGRLWPGKVFPAALGPRSETK